MTCPSRFLLADGHVATCALPHGPVSADPPKIHTDSFMDVKGRGVHWRPSDPCAFEATPCPDCRGTGSQPGGTGCTLGCDPCEACGGTGWDDRIPPDMIGVGSVLRERNDRASEFLVVAREGLLYVMPSGHPPVSTVDPADLATDWDVVRAVPPSVATGDDL